MTSDTHDTSNARADVVQHALKHIGRAIHVRRSLLGIRQTDLGERTGLQGSQISRVESASSSARLSTIVVLLDELGLLNDVLAALPVDSGDDVGERVGMPRSTNTQACDAANKLLSTGRFLAVFDHDPSVELPVSSRASIELRRRGFAVRLCDHESLGSINYVTSIANAQYSEHKYLIEGGEIGGYKHLSVVVAGKPLSDEQADVAPMVLNVIADKINDVIDGFKLRVTSIEFDAEATAHVVTTNGKAIESAYIYDKVCDVINSAEWNSHE